MSSRRDTHSMSPFRPSRSMKDKENVTIMGIGKENVPVRAGANAGHGRSLSFGGIGIEGPPGTPNASASFLSPTKKARRDLAPRRSILKPRPSAFALEDGSEPSGSYHTADENTTKTFGRRVSFAPTAHMREFEKDPDESQQQLDEDSDSDMDIADGDGDTVYTRSRLSDIQRQQFMDDQEWDESVDESVDMDVTIGGDTIYHRQTMQFAQPTSQNDENLTGTYDTDDTNLGGKRRLSDTNESDDANKRRISSSPSAGVTSIESGDSNTASRRSSSMGASDMDISRDSISTSVDRRSSATTTSIETAATTATQEQSDPNMSSDMDISQDSLLSHNAKLQHSSQQPQETSPRQYKQSLQETLENYPSRPVTPAPAETFKAPEEIVPEELSADMSVDQNYVRDEENDTGDSASMAPPPLSLNQFFELTEIYFNEAVSMKKRQSIANTDDSKKDDTPTLASYAIATASMIPFIEMYHMMSQDMRNSLTDNEDFLEQVENSFEMEAPTVVRNYLAAGDEEKAIMATQFKLTKAYFRLVVKDEWYSYRTEVFDKVCSLLQQRVDSLRQDAETFENLQPNVNNLLPLLRKRKEELLREVENEKARQIELESCDKDRLANLHDGIDEQKIVIEEAMKEKADLEGQLGRLNRRIEECEVQRKEAEDVIAESRAVCQDIKYLNKGVAYRLRDELDALERLHGWRILGFSKNRAGLEFLELSHLNEIAVQVNTSTMEATVMSYKEWEEYRGKNSRAGENRKRNKDLVAENREFLTMFLLDRMNDLFMREEKGGNITSQLANISFTWTRSRRLRKEFMVAMTRYPCVLSLTKQHSSSRKSGSNVKSLELKYRVFSRKRGLAMDISVYTNGEEGAVSELGCSVSAVENSIGELGNIAKEASYVVRECMSDGGQNVLLEACTRAEAV